MSLMRWHPHGELRTIRDRIDDLFQDFGFGELAGTWSGWEPRVDLSETENEFIVRAEVPGMEEKDIEVSVHGDALTLKGERSQATEQQGERFYRSERSYGKFLRTIPLPDAVDSENVTASYSKGVLEVRLPKPEAKKARQIKVQTV